ncbi:hypothetical protein A2Z22_04930 [Candidatus Woesebacteria bacterium RBG_16_34_12]|uniref:Uncharacterized protein n=1 Tax=Candidatus Woesebacteria bacterium RBG_16_34_12 TaxID=1802480 RepID=A0A1F7XAF5_9BACT|nr:MAG: hypothetical protein A2Z22_04930 [Candidatus Woesebacteria bacterium RBG_16_34_12]
MDEPHILVGKEKQPPKSLPQQNILMLTALALVFILSFIIGFTYKSRQLLKTISQSNPNLPTPASINLTPTPDLVANWKTYTNTKIGYTLKYPKAEDITSCQIKKDYEVDEFSDTVKIIPETCLAHRFIIFHQSNPEKLDPFEYFMQGNYKCEQLTDDSYNCKRHFTIKYKGPDLDSEYQVSKIKIGGKDSIYAKVIKAPSDSHDLVIIPVQEDIVINISLNSSQITKQILSTIWFLERDKSTTTEELKIFMDPNNIFSVQYPGNWFIHQLLNQKVSLSPSPIVDCGRCISITLELIQEKIPITHEPFLDYKPEGPTPTWIPAKKYPMNLYNAYFYEGTVHAGEIKIVHIETPDKTGYVELNLIYPKEQKLEAEKFFNQILSTFEFLD